MRESRWISRAVPGVIAVWAFVAVASSSLGAAERPWVPAPCPGAARPGAGEDGSWYRLDPILEAGERRGQRLVAGRGEDQRPRVIELDSESFAAGPFGGQLLVGTDDGRRSTLSLLDIAAGCAWPVGTSVDVIRRATLAPDGGAIYEARVARDTRTDLGIWHRPIAGEATPVQVLAAIDADARFGRTWSTEFAWSEDQGHLAVQSCAEASCRTRILEPSTGAVRASSDPALGDLVGLTADRLVVHGACRGLPCPLLSVAIDDGRVDVLHPAAGQAVVTTTPADGTRVVLETTPDGGSLQSLGLHGTDGRDLPPPLEGLQLVPRASRSGGAIDIDPAWLVFGPGGRLPLGDAGVPLLRRIDTDRLVPLGEVSR